MPPHAYFFLLLVTISTHFIGFREYTTLDKIAFGQLHWLPPGYNEIETYVLSDMLMNMRVYQELSEQSEDDSVEIWLRVHVKKGLHRGPSFLGKKVHHLEIAKLKLFCVIYSYVYM